MTFALFLIFIAVPRSDDSTFIQGGLTQEQCEQASGELNAMHRDLLTGSEPKFLWACRPEIPKPEPPPGDPAP